MIGLGPVGWVILGVVVIGAAAYTYDKYQSSCYAHDSCGSDDDGGAANPADRWTSPELAQVRSLAAAVNNNNLYDQLFQQMMTGASAAQLLSYIELHWSSHPAVQEYTAAHTPAATPPTVATPPVPKVTWTPPRAAPAPPIEQTITNVVAPVVALLPAGQMLQNALPVSAALTIPAILQANADGTESANIVPAAITAAIVNELGGTADPDPDDDGNDRDAVSEWLVNVVEDAAAEVMAQGLAGFPLSDPMEDRLKIMRGEDRTKDADNLQCIFRGNRFHLAVRDLLRCGTRTSSATAAVVGTTRAPTSAPAFGPGRGADHAGENNRHVARGGLYDPCMFAFYTMPTE